jgi:predicted extracellular nuclease
MGPFRRPALLSFLALAFAFAPAARAQLVVNEIDYDQPSTDTAEFIEIKNVSGTTIDLDAYNLELVNGSGGGAVVYQTINLPSFPLAAGEYYVVCASAAATPNCDLDVSPDSNLVQNGSPDAVAIATGLAIVDTVSYGGATGAPYTEGTGSGTDSSSVAFVSLSRFPDGADTNSNSADVSLRCITPGAANTAAATGCASPAAPVLVVNEIDYDQVGTDASEFIEIKNAGTAAVDLDPYAIHLVNGNAGGALVFQTIDLPAFVLAPGDYFVVCANAAETVNCDLDVLPDTNLIMNGSPDAVGLALGAVVVDAVSYEGNSGAPYTEGSGVGLEDDPAVDFAGISRFPDGADTNVNNLDLSPRCITPGAANAAAATACSEPAEVVLLVNEIDYDQPGTDASEFVEIKNAGTGAVNLDAYALVLVNGTGTTVYQTIDLPPVLLAAGDYFVVCASAAATPECDLDVAPDTNLVQNGAPDAVAVVLGATVLDTVSYEGDTGAPYTEGSGVGLEDSGAANFISIGRFPDGADTGVNNVDLSPGCITPGEANSGATTGCNPPGVVEAEIFAIQGAGLVSPLALQTVRTLDNVVTALAGDGFFIQTPDARADADPETSNGIFVFTGAAPLVAVGDVVDVQGLAQEFFDFTEIGGTVSVTIDSSGAALPAFVPFDGATPSPNQPQPATEYERYEGMRVAVVAGSVGGPNQRFGVDPLAEVHVTASASRAFREPGILFPGLPGLPVWDGNPEVFELDPDRLGLANAEIPAGSSFSATGVLGFEFGGFELWPTALSFTPAALPRPVRERTAAEYTVGSLNLFRLFDDVDDPGIDETVVSTAEYQRRLEKFSRYIREVMKSPDILAVEEAEKVQVLDALAARILADDAGVVYSAYLFEGHDIGGIDTGFLVRATVQVQNVTQLAAGELFSVDGSFLHDRPPVLLEATVPGAFDPTAIQVIAVHNRSLGGIEDPVDGPRVRQKRLEQAQSIATLVQDLQDGDPDVPLVVIGDFNAFEFSDGYVDAVGQIRGVFDPADNLLSGPDLVDPDLDNQVLSLPAGERYSFVFDGSAQVLDHALTTGILSGLVRGFEYGRGNADAAVDRINDAATPLRASDHDGAVLFLARDGDGDGVGDDDDDCPKKPNSDQADDDGDGLADGCEDLCRGTVVPEGVPTESLATNHWALVDADRVFDTSHPRNKPPKESFDLDDTGGCSCEQIIDILHLGSGHTKHGCSTGAMKLWALLVKLINHH